VPEPYRGLYVKRAAVWSSVGHLVSHRNKLAPLHGLPIHPDDADDSAHNCCSTIKGRDEIIRLSGATSISVER